MTCEEAEVAPCLRRNYIEFKAALADASLGSYTLSSANLYARSWAQPLSEAGLFLNAFRRVAWNVASGGA
jgi:hypothetical protein